MTAALAEIEALPVIALRPRITDDCRSQIASLSDALAALGDNRSEVTAILRGLIDNIRVTPAKQGRGVDVEVTGRLAAILALATGEPVIDQSVRQRRAAPGKSIAGLGRYTS